MRISFSVVRSAAQQRSPRGFGFGDLALLLERQRRLPLTFAEQALCWPRQLNIPNVINHNTPIWIRKLAHFTFLSIQILAPRLNEPITGKASAQIPSGLGATSATRAKYRAIRKIHA